MTRFSRGVSDSKLRLIAWLVPKATRADWRKEWTGEMARVSAPSDLGLGGALRHALTLRSHDVDVFLQDIVFAVRSALARPGFSIAVVLTVALGIGANTGVFSLVNSVLLRPLPFSSADRMYLLFERDSSGGQQLASYPTFVDWRDQAAAFDGLSFVRGTGLIVPADERSSSLLGAFVTEDFFPSFEVKPVLGRTLTSGDFNATANPVVVLSTKVWQTVFRADPGVLGKTVTLGEVVATVVGVVPTWFVLPQWTPAAGTDVWMPLNAMPFADRAALMQRDFHADSRVFGRVERTVGLARAQVEMNGIASNLAIAYPQSSSRFDSVDLVPLRDRIVGNVAPRLYTLAAAVMLVLLICCVNLANLFLSRTTSRKREFAIRAALGAGRGRLFRQLLTESMVLCVLGGAGGTAAAMVIVGVVRSRIPAALPRFEEVTVDWRVLGVSGLLVVLTTVVLATFSIRQIGNSDMSAPLKRSADGAQGVPGGSRSVLVAVQVALSMILLVGAALLAKSLIRLSVVDAGFDDNGLVAVRLFPRFPRYDAPDDVLTLYEQITANVASLPGVTDVGIINHAPFGGGGIPSRASRFGDPRASSDETSVWYRTVSAGYFSVMGIPILAGREFTDVDLNGAAGALIVNETFARVWGSELPVGSQLTVLKSAKERPDFGEPLLGTVVGVVGDVKHFGLDAPPAPVVYVPFTHDPWAHAFLVVRTASRPDHALNAIEDAVRSVEPNLPLDGLGMGAATMASRMGSSLTARRVNTVFVGAFGIAALCLAMVGIYGVTAYSVVAERRAIGIRLALGASSGAITKGVVTRYLAATLVGLLAGLSGALALSRLMTSLLFDVQPHDPVIFVAVAMALLGATGLASYLPARRAAGIDPVATLKTG